MNSPSTPDEIGYDSLLDYLRHPDVEEAIRRLARAGNNDSRRFATFTFPVPAIDPLACLELLYRPDAFHFYWEHPEQEIAFSAGERVAELSSSGPGRFQEMSAKVREIEQISRSCSLVRHSLAGLHLVGGFSFFDEIEDSDWKSFGTASLSIPGWILIRDGKLGLLTLAVPAEPGEGIGILTDKLRVHLTRFDELYRSVESLKSEYSQPPEWSKHYLDTLKTPDSSWIATVEKAKKLIYSRTLEKIVLAREVRWSTGSDLTATHVLNALRNQYPTCYNFLFHNSRGKSFIGCSPERLVSFHKKYLLTESLAGSTSRGKTATEDLFLEKRLLTSKKNRSEHSYVMKAIEKRLRPFIRKLESADVPGVKKLKNVQHLFTPVTAWLNNNVDRFSILEQLHPTPAVGGYPREEALSHIRQLELFDRGWYAGPVGWLNLNGGGEFAVAIRSGLIDEREARLFAGCGIVEDSDPYTEWEETNLKLMPMLSAFRHDEFGQAE